MKKTFSLPGCNTEHSVATPDYLGDEAESEDMEQYMDSIRNGSGWWTGGEFWKRTLVTELVRNIAGIVIPASVPIWRNSQLRLIQDILKLLSCDLAAQYKLNACKKKNGKLSSVELKRLEKLSSILLPFADFTDAIQGEHETVGLVLPGLCDITNKLDQLKNEVMYVRALILARQQALKDRFSWCCADKYLCMGAALEPH